MHGEKEKHIKREGYSEKEEDGEEADDAEVDEGGE